MPQQAKRIEELIDRARHADAEVRRVREGASYAGDPDPYRSPVTERSDETEGDDEADRTGGEDGSGRPPAR